MNLEKSVASAQAWSMCLQGRRRADAMGVGHHRECHGRGRYRGKCRAVNNMAALVSRRAAKNIAAEWFVDRLTHRVGASDVGAGAKAAGSDHGCHACNSKRAAQCGNFLPRAA